MLQRREGGVDEVIIREVKAEDVRRAAEIAVAAWTPIYELRRQTMGEKLFAALHRDWKKRKAGQIVAACSPKSGRIVRVAERNGHVVGFITFTVDKETGVGEIGNNAVDPQSQGMGIGGKMYQVALDEMRKHGIRFVQVSTGGDQSHAPARRAYERAGFNIQLPSVTYYRKL